MTKITVVIANEEIILLDTESIKLGEISKYYEKLVNHKKLDEALQLLACLDEKEYWRAAILLKHLQKKRMDAEDPELRLLLQQCKEFASSNLLYSFQISNMSGLSCYRVGVDAGAGFKQGDLDVLGMEGFLHCTGLLVTTEDAQGASCYYMAHIFGDRKTALAVKEELARILIDLEQLSGRKLGWSDLSGQVILVGIGSSTEEPSLCYKQVFKILMLEKASPIPLFAESVAFNLTGKGDLILLDPPGQLNQGIQSRIPRAGHGFYSPVDNIHDMPEELIITIEEQIADSFINESRIPSNR